MFELQINWWHSGCNLSNGNPMLSRGETWLGCPPAPFYDEIMVYSSTGAFFYDMLAGVDPPILVDRDGSIPPEGHLLPLFPPYTALSHHLLPISGLNIYSRAWNHILDEIILPFLLLQNQLSSFDTGTSVSQQHAVSGICVPVSMKWMLKTFYFVLNLWSPSLALPSVPGATLSVPAAAAQCYYPDYWNTACIVFHQEGESVKGGSRNSCYCISSFQ